METSLTTREMIIHTEGKRQRAYTITRTDPEIEQTGQKSYYDYHACDPTICKRDKKLSSFPTEEKHENEETTSFHSGQNTVFKNMIDLNYRVCHDKSRIENIGTISDNSKILRRQQFFCDSKTEQ